jgi:hypothetical protein
MRRARDTPVATNSFVRSERTPQSQGVAVLIFLKPFALFIFELPSGFIGCSTPSDRTNVMTAYSLFGVVAH